MVASLTAAVQRLETAVDDRSRASYRDSPGYEGGSRLLIRGPACVRTTLRLPDQFFERLAAAAPTPGSYAHTQTASVGNGSAASHAAAPGRLNGTRPARSNASHVVLHRDAMKAPFVCRYDGPLAVPSCRPHCPR